MNDCKFIELKVKTKNKCWGKSEIHDFLFQIRCPSFQFPVSFQSWEDQLYVQLVSERCSWIQLETFCLILHHPTGSHQSLIYVPAGREKNPFLIIILVASCNGGSVKAPLCTKGNRRPKKATVTCYGCRHIVRFSSPVCWAPWESLFHGNAFRNFSCALSSREDLNYVCNSMSNLKRSSECQDDLRSLPFYKRNKYIADGHGHFWLYIRTTF